MNFDVNITLEDTICCKCCKNTIIRTIHITNSNQKILLQNNYILNVISVNTTYFTVLIQNGIEIIIRNIYTNYQTEIYLPNSECITHILKIGGTI